APVGPVNPIAAIAPPSPAVVAEAIAEAEAPSAPAPNAAATPLTLPPLSFPVADPAPAAYNGASSTLEAMQAQFETANVDFPDFAFFF
ncbi:MAG: hypothetical protein AAGC56_13200, partial [Pseudomonadota bacterium]